MVLPRTCNGVSHHLGRTHLYKFAAFIKIANESSKTWYDDAFIVLLCVAALNVHFVFQTKPRPSVQAACTNNIMLHV